MQKKKNQQDLDGVEKANFNFVIQRKIISAFRKEILYFFFLLKHLV